VHTVRLEQYAKEAILMVMCALFELELVEHLSAFISLLSQGRVGGGAKQKIPQNYPNHHPTE